MSVARAGIAGGVAGVLATGGMYGVAVLDLAASGTATSSWGPAIEVAFGGNAGAILGLSGPALHVVHGCLLGCAAGIALGLLRPTSSVPRIAATFGIPFGLVLWLAVLALSSPVRSLSGAGPPVLLSLGMHLAFGIVVAVAIAWCVQGKAPRGHREPTVRTDTPDSPSENPTPLH